MLSLLTNRNRNSAAKNNHEIQVVSAIPNRLHNLFVFDGTNALFECDVFIACLRVELPCRIAMQLPTAKNRVVSELLGLCGFYAADNQQCWCVFLLFKRHCADADLCSCSTTKPKLLCRVLVGNDRLFAQSSGQHYLGNCLDWTLRAQLLLRGSAAFAALTSHCFTCSYFS